MADWKQHAVDCEEIIGSQWVVVHQWLDEFAKIYWPAKIHRIHRHHREGVEIVREKWGDEAAKAAVIHILTDEGEVKARNKIFKDYGAKFNEDGTAFKDAEEKDN